MMKDDIKDQQDYNLLHDEAVQAIVKSKEWLESMRNSPDHPILKNYSDTLPYENNITDQKAIEIREIANRLRGNVKNINSGGCGWFAILLQDIKGGDIYHYNLLVKRNGKYIPFDDHEILIVDDYCYDSEGVIRESTLREIKQPIFKAESIIEVHRRGLKESYYLFKVTKENILLRYEEGTYLSPLFSEYDIKELQRNAASILKELNR
jgi:hypothetical protein